MEDFLMQISYNVTIFIKVRNGFIIIMVVMINIKFFLKIVNVVCNSKWDVLNHFNII